MPRFVFWVASCIGAVYARPAMKPFNAAVARFAFLMLPLAAVNASAATLLVTSESDAPLAVSATTCTTDSAVTDGSACSLRAALQFAAADDVITFADNARHFRPQSYLVSTSNVVIRGRSDARVTLDGSNKYGLFGAVAGNVTFEFVDFVRGVGTDSGVIFFGARTSQCTALLIDSTISDNLNELGPVVRSNCTLGLQRTIVANNRSAIGAIYELPRAAGGLLVSESSFTNNTQVADRDVGGGAIRSEATTAVTKSSFSGNRSDEGAAIRAGGSLLVQDTVLSDNQLLAPGPNSGELGRCGGAVFAGFEAEGPQPSGPRQTTIRGSTFNANSARECGGALAINATTSVTIERSAFTNNEAATSGGGVFVRTNQPINVSASSIAGNRLTAEPRDTNRRGGGGFYAENGPGASGPTGVLLTMRNVTIANNQNRLPQNGGQLVDGGGLAVRYPRTVVLNHVTIADNEIYKASGSGLWLQSDTVGNALPTIRIANSIIARNRGTTDCAFEIAGLPTTGISQGFNAVNASCPSDATGDIVTDEPGLDSAGVKNNGGPTPTIALVSGGAAVDAASESPRFSGEKEVNPFGCEPSDQRAVDRPQDGGKALRCDIGAFEYQQSADVAITKTVGGAVVVGETMTFTLTVRNLGPDGAQGVEAQDTLPVSLSPTSATASQGTCSVSAQTVTCELGSLAKDASATITVQATTKVVGVDSNTATVTTSTANDPPGNNSSTVVFEVKPVAPDGGSGPGGVQPQGDNNASVTAPAIGSFSGSGLGGRPGCQASANVMDLSVLALLLLPLLRRLVRS